MIELSEVIRQLRLELDRARLGAAGEDLLFELGPVELEVTVGLESVGGVEAKVRFWVIEIGGDAHATSSSTQRVKLTLHPTVTGHVEALGSGRHPAYVAGEEATGER